MKKYLIPIFFLIIILFSITVGASYGAGNQDPLNLEGPEQQETELNQSLKMGGLLARYIFSVAGILVLTYLGVRIYARSTSPLTEYGDWIQVLDYMPLGTNRGFYLVEIEGKGLVLGITEQQINVLATIEEQARLDELRGLSLKKKNSSKFNMNLWTNKKDNDFQKSLQEHIIKTQNLYHKQNKGDKTYEK